MNCLPRILALVALVALALPTSAQIRIGNLPATNRTDDFQFAGANGTGSGAPARLLSWSNLNDSVWATVEWITTNSNPSNAWFLTAQGGAPKLVAWSNLLDGISGNVTSTEPRNLSLLGNVAGSPRLVTPGTLRSNWPSPGRAIYPVDVPTFDGYGSTVHYDVVFVPEGYAGYSYWLAHTPFPDASREDPSILASNDGLSWETPAGLTNPIYSKVQCLADNWGWNADPDLVLRHDGKLALYWMSYIDAGGGNWGARLSYTDTTNGVTWSTRQTVLTVTNTGETGLISPAVVLEPDDSYSMWYASRPSGYDPTAVLKLRTSADGITWGSEENCTYFTFTNNGNVFPGIWHVNVSRVDTNYFMLVMGKNSGATDNYNIYWGTSSNKTQWHFDRVTEHLQSRTYYDTQGFYRGAFVPRPGLPLRWDFWLPSFSIHFMNTNHPTNVVAGADQPVRMMFFGEVPMPDRSIPKVSVIIPPATVAVGSVTNSYPATNTYLGLRFNLTDAAWIRYANFMVISNAGNLEVGIFRMSESGHNTGTQWINPTRFACPVPGAVRQDIGLRYLPPGDYVAYLWASNPAFQTYCAQRFDLYRAKVVAADINLQTVEFVKNIFPWSSWTLGGFTLEGDF
jgi:hypothetical protein